ncbi:hypothetical protein EZ449_21330 [Pedobacter frigidisoli]|uniref:HNH endonuclease n=1 Tax=Pedobacter frigidisoli TaxID=2530455 RepID=A0A4R0NIX1_9SPHI|nr:hypothetical protein [Pedobacter frigidisoli]TCC99757.1 hypothetical protein EZ449_21330 [Pedobacter frigidisoli]
MERDNFLKSTTRILAERVGYRCSNPNCRAYTVGPNEKENKSTSVGEAAHICAAAGGGARYDESMTSVQRSDISNGLWLCSNCSDLIDKDYENYSVQLLKKWKAEAELEMYQNIKGGKRSTAEKHEGSPYLEVDLRYNSSGRWNEGYSYKNPREVGENGEEVMIIGFDTDPIIYWKLDWEYSLFIYNNSSYPAYNIQVDQISNHQFSQISRLPKINNLQQMGKMELTAEYISRMEGIYKEADEYLKHRIPEALDGLQLQITYLDEKRETHTTLVTIKGQDVISQKV